MNTSEDRYEEFEKLREMYNMDSYFPPIFPHIIRMYHYNEDHQAIMGPEIKPLSITKNGRTITVFDIKEAGTYKIEFATEKDQCDHVPVDLKNEVVESGVACCKCWKVMTKEDLDDYENKHESNID